MFFCNKTKIRYKRHRLEMITNAHLVIKMIQWRQIYDISKNNL